MCVTEQFSTLFSLAQKCAIVSRVTHMRAKLHHSSLQFVHTSEICNKGKVHGEEFDPPHLALAWRRDDVGICWEDTNSNAAFHPNPATVDSNFIFS